jgi:hypothetical protein
MHDKTFSDYALNYWVAWNLDRFRLCDEPPTVFCFHIVYSGSRLFQEQHHAFQQSVFPLVLFLVVLEHAANSSYAMLL